MAADPIERAFDEALESGIAEPWEHTEEVSDAGRARAGDEEVIPGAVRSEPAAPGITPPDLDNPEDVARYAAEHAERDRLHAEEEAAYEALRYLPAYQAGDIPDPVHLSPEEAHAVWLSAFETLDTQAEALARYEAAAVRLWAERRRRMEERRDALAVMVRQTHLAVVERGGPKTVETPGGTASRVRSCAEHIEITDKKAALAWAEAEVPEAVTLKPALDAVKFKAFATLRIVERGEEVPGAELVQGRNEVAVTRKRGAR